MRKILVATAAFGMLAAFSLAPQQAQARDCVRLTATAHGATQGFATRRAERRLQRYISRNLAGARVGHYSTSCTGWGVEGFRAACESSAIVCR
jgi:hypothetical protein